jgi:hypothetical protein
MFERMSCPDQQHPATSPFVGMPASTVLSHFIVVGVSQFRFQGQIRGRLMTKQILARPSPTRLRVEAADLGDADASVAGVARRSMPLNSPLMRLLLVHPQVSRNVSPTENNG